MACNCELWPMQGGLVVLAEAMCGAHDDSVAWSRQASENGYTYLCWPACCFTADLCMVYNSPVTSIIGSSGIVQG